MSGKKLRRETFRTSRLLDFFSEKELTAQIGHPKADWPLVVCKESMDNGIDAAEDLGIPPQIAVQVNKEGISVRDNGPGIPANTVAGILDFAARVSSREAYVSPTRGKQGNGAKTMLPMPFVLDGAQGKVTIKACGIHHEIRVSVDRIKQEPKIDHQQHKDRNVKNGTSFQVHWPESASSLLMSCKRRFLQIAEDYTFLNPHLTLTVDWFGEQTEKKATDSTWKKWLPSDPTPPHFYSLERFERLVSAYLSNDADTGRERTIREFIAEFAGLTATAKQKALLEKLGLHRAVLSSLRNGDGLDHARTRALLEAMKAQTSPVKPAALGIIGKEHLKERFNQLGCEMETFAYRKETGETDDVPWVMETAFAWSPKAGERRLISGVNWSPSIINPFRQLGRIGKSLDSVLEQQRVGSDEPVVMVLHLAYPCVGFTDQGKSALVIDDDQDDYQDADDDL